MDLHLAPPAWHNTTAASDTDSFTPNSRDDQLQQRDMQLTEVCKITTISFGRQQLVPHSEWQHDTAAEANRVGPFMRLTLQPARAEAAGFVGETRRMLAPGHQRLQYVCEIYPVIGGAKFFKLLELKLDPDKQLQHGPQQQAQQQQLDACPTSQAAAIGGTTLGTIGPVAAAVAAAAAGGGAGRRRVRVLTNRDSDYEYTVADALPSPNRIKRSRGAAHRSTGLPETMSTNKQKLKVNG